MKTKTNILSLALAILLLAGLFPGAPALAADKGVITFYTDSPGGTLTRDEVEAQLAAAGVGENDTFTAEFGMPMNIGDYAFAGCTGLTDVAIELVGRIGIAAFSGTGLTSIDTPLLGIEGTFANCKSLTSAVIGNSVTRIFEGDFYGCSSLASVVIGSSVAYIQNVAFYECTSLSEVYINGDAPSVEPLAFDYIAPGAIAYVYPSAKGFPAEGQLWYGLIVKYREDPAPVKTITFHTDSEDGMLTQYEVAAQLAAAGVGKNDTFAAEFDPSVLSIGYDAFSGCTGLTDVTIEYGVTRIGEWAFADCTGLTSVDIPDSVTDIGIWAFSYTGLTSIDIPDSVTRFGGECTFAGCKNLTSAVIGNGVTSIGESEFAYCSNLASVVIGSSVTNIQISAFNECVSLTEIYFNGDAPNVNQWAFDGMAAGVIAYVYPSAKGFPAEGQLWYGLIVKYREDPAPVKTITFHTDNEDGMLTQEEVNAQLATAGVEENDTFSAAFDASITAIGWAAFYARYGLTRVNLSDSVTDIGGFAFAYCNITDLLIPDSVTTIGDFAFAFNAITSVVIPESVTRIDDRAFGFCDRLTEVNVDPNNDNYSSLDGVLFNKNKSTLLQYPGGISGGYTIPDSVTTIADGSFDGCHDLTSAFIPASVESVGFSPFSDCYNMMEVIVAPENKHYMSENGVLFNNNQTALVQYPIGKLGGYVIPDSVTSIDAESFMGCRSLTSVVIGDSATTIDHNAFLFCRSLTSVVIPKSVTGIGVDAFGECTALSEVYFDGDAPGVGEQAFLGTAPDAAAYVYPSAKGFPPEGDLWNGLIVKYREEILVPVITSVKVTPTIVQGCAANVVIEVEVVNLEGRTITASLFGKTAVLEGKRGVIRLEASDVTDWGYFNVVVAVDGTDVTDNSGEIYVEKKNDDIWKVPFGSESGKLKLIFAEPVTLKSVAGGNVSINNEPYTHTLSDDRLSIVVNVDAAITGTIVVKGVKYERLFPSYSFTFTLQK